MKGFYTTLDGNYETIPVNAALCWQCGCWLADTDTDDEQAGLCNACYHEN